MKLGFIGMGNMSSAIARGVLASGFIQGKDICAYNPTASKVQAIADLYPITAMASGREVAAWSDMVLLGVKPDTINTVAAEIADKIKGKALLSVAGGWTHDRLQEAFPGARCLYVLPNTPVEVGCGLSLFENTTGFTAEELMFARGLFGSIGRVKTLPTAQMSIGSAVSGCGPAFAYLFIEALGDAGVLHGLTRPDAYELAAGMMAGAAAMVLEGQKHPGELKDNVCSPGGSTIRGVAALEEKGLRAAAIAAVNAVMSL